MKATFHGWLYLIGYNWLRVPIPGIWLVSDVEGRELSRKQGSETSRDRDVWFRYLLSPILSKVWTSVTIEDNLGKKEHFMRHQLCRMCENVEATVPTGLFLAENKMVFCLLSCNYVNIIWLQAKLVHKSDQYKLYPEKYAPVEAAFSFNAFDVTFLVLLKKYIMQ